MSGHTELPWYILGEDEDGGVPVIGISSGEMGARSYKNVCEVQSTLNETTDEFLISEIDRKNAALIVTACNSHADLVKALEECRRRLKMDLDEIQHLRGWLSDSELAERADQDEAADEADKAAIAQADRALATLTARKVG